MKGEVSWLIGCAVVAALAGFVVGVVVWEAASNAAVAILLGTG